MTPKPQGVRSYEEYLNWYDRLPIRDRVAIRRSNILPRCLKWRALIPNGIRHGIAPLQMLKWEQSRLAELRCWRATGQRASVH